MSNQDPPTHIPITSRSGQERMFETEHLPANSEEMCNILKEENAQMIVYLRFALHYNMFKSDPNIAISILKKGLSQARGSNDEKIRLNNLLASLYYISAQNPITWVVKGFIYLGRNDPDAAYTAFKNAFGLANHNIPALFGM
ncbi:15305_t:CDS:2, partial [Cetraspora pellucida]